MTVTLASLDGAEALIVQSTFASLPEVAEARIPLIPFGKMFHEQLNSVEKIKQFHGPVLLSHGTIDRTIPFRQGRQLVDAAGGPVTFYPVEQGRHQPPDDEEYFDTVIRVLDSLKNK